MEISTWSGPAVALLHPTPHSPTSMIFLPRLQTNHTAYPTAEAYTHKLVLEEQNVTRTLTLCPTQLVKGEWALAVYNPLRGFQVRLRAPFLLKISRHLVRKHAAALSGDQKRALSVYVLALLQRPTR